MSHEARTLIEQTALDYEAGSIPWMAKYAKEDLANLRKNGMEIIDLKGAAAREYLSIGYERLWKRLSGMEYIRPFDTLKALMYVPG